MALDLGNIPVYATPSEAEQAQIREAIGINDNIGTSTADALARRAAKGGLIFDLAGKATLPVSSMDFGTGDFALYFDGFNHIGAFTAQQNIFNSHGTAGNNRMFAYIATSGNLSVSFRDNVGANTTYSFGNIITQDDCAGLLIVFDRDGFAKAYLDDSEVGSVDISSSSGVDLGLSNTNAPELFNNSAAIMSARSFTPFNTALTAQQAADIYTYGIDEFLARNKELKWGGVEGGVYTSDFSAGVDGWADLSATVTGNVDAIGGLDDNLSIQPDATTAAHRSDQVLLITGKAQKITCDVYIPSANVLVDTFFIREAVSGLISNSVTATDTWTAVELSLDSVVNSTIQLFPSDGGSTNYLSNGTDLVYVRNIKVTDLGALSHLPLNDDCRQLRDVSTNRFDAIASATGVEHILPKDTHVFRDDNADGTGGSYLVAAADILTASETITGVTVEGRFYAASGAQTLTYRRIRLLTSGSDILVQRSNGTTHETIATVTPVSVTDFAISVSTQRV